MGRTYAGILALVAFMTVLVRGMTGGGEVAPTIKIACLCLVAFGMTGYILGHLAQWIVEDSVRAKLHADFETHHKGDHPNQNST